MSVTITIPSRLGPVRTVGSRDPNARDITSLYSEVLKHVRDLGLLRRRRGFYIATFAVLMLALGGALTGFVLLGSSWFQLLIAAAIGIICTQLAFLAHEAAHRQIFATPAANDWAGRLIGNGIVGMSYHWWNHKHSAHHTHPNTIGKDPDIDSPFVAFHTEEAAKRSGFRGQMMKIQGYLLFPLIAFLGISLQFTSVQRLIIDKQVKYRAVELSLLALRLGGVVVVVFLMLPFWLALSFLLVQVVVFGIYMGSSFAPNHKGMPILPHDSKVDFFSRQVLTGRNIRGWGMTALMGGLNYQVEHHLFPDMPRPALRKAAVVVRKYCETHKVPYTETTLIESYAIIIRYLNRVGLRHADPFDCPVVANTRLH